MVANPPSRFSLASPPGGRIAFLVQRTPAPTHRPAAGFTLIELMIVMVIIGLLAAIAVPAYVHNVRNAREAVLKEDLHTLRSAIDSYTIDKQKAPQTLDDLVQAGYLKVMPVDPFTHRSDTWQPVQTDALQSLDQTDTGIGDVHSGAQMLAVRRHLLQHLVAQQPAPANSCAPAPCPSHTQSSPTGAY